MTEIEAHLGRIEGSVAQILNAREVVINRGATDGVELGMRFAILNRRGQRIKDPESGEVLGSIEVEKTVVKVVRIQDKLCVARTFRRTGSGLFASAVFDQLSAGGPETLRTDRTLREEIPEEESVVKIGDPVVQVIGDEFGDNP